MILGKYSIGIGDRFGREGKAQLAALIKAREAGVEITPVWNKSNQEHEIIGTKPLDVRREADEAVKACGWTGPYFVDADRIGLSNVDAFIEASDFFTLDMAGLIGPPSPEEFVSSFVDRHRDLCGVLRIPGIERAFEIKDAKLTAIASKYVNAVKEAGKTYRHIESRKGKDTFVTEVSMDETDAPQPPVELLIILAAMADEGIPAQTVAPKFSGRFNKGIDYVGDIGKFTREFEQDLAVIQFAIERFGLPKTLKLSIHSGSDKFSIYDPIQLALKKFNMGLHVKTAGTTWLEELVGLALDGDEGLAIARDIYAQAVGRIDELCAPYAAVIDVKRDHLPSLHEVRNWDGEMFGRALRHDPFCATYNPCLRQLLHVGYKIAAEMGPRFITALESCQSTIARQVTTNLFDRHIRPLFLDD
jgi:tagaturonate epimerase